jgi:uroporphyrinogen-III decarboxylase
MDNVEIKSSSMNSEISTKMEPCKTPVVSATPESPDNLQPAQLTPKQVEYVISTWKIVKDEVTLPLAGFILFEK